MNNFSPRPDPWDADGRAHALAWAALVEAGRIGTPAALTPAQAATLAANDALFRDRARRARAARQEG